MEKQHARQTTGHQPTHNNNAVDPSLNQKIHFSIHERLLEGSELFNDLGGLNNLCNRTRALESLDFDLDLVVDLR
ncbi:MAG: hypothetical protein ACXV3U_09135, partial [Halobacteriota archaeon]